MTLRIIVAATLVPIVVIIAAVALYFATGWGNSETGAPLEGRIVFWSDYDGDGGIDEEYVINFDESGETLLPYDEARDGMPSGSPDGRQFVLAVSERQRDFEIYLFNPDEMGLTLLAHDEASGAYLYQSPEGRRVSLTSHADFINYLATRSGGSFLNPFTHGPGVTQLTDNYVDDIPAGWTPDGRIGFISDRDGDYEIYLMNSDGSDVTQLTHNEAYEGTPIWSPDGRRIVFTSYRDGNTEIYVMNSDGSGVTRLTRNEAVDDRPIWSPDGRHIAFSSDRDGDIEIYVMRSDGSGVTQLTHNEAEDFIQYWLPVPDAPSPS